MVHILIKIKKKTSKTVIPLLVELLLSDLTDVRQTKCSNLTITTGK
jgi:hypothetical protein